MDGLINCHIVNCSKLAINWFVAKPYPIPNRLLVIKRNFDRKVPINNLLCKNLGDGTLVIMQMATICAHSKYGYL